MDRLADISTAQCEAFRQVAVQAARSAGQVLVDWQGKFAVRQKRPGDLVTDADVAAQRAVEEAIALAFPAHHLLGEESAQHERPADDQVCWIVDPLDGTTNYVHGFPAWSVSIAACRGQELLAGAIFHPGADEMFSASRGAGARLNDQAIATSGCAELASALVTVSLPPGVRADSPDMLNLVRVAEQSQGLRRLGSAALNLAYLACGRVDAFWASEIFPWDVAAGILLVREAGGTVTGLAGQPFDLYRPHFRAASTRQLHAELGSVLTTGTGSAAGAS